VGRAAGDERDPASRELGDDSERPGAVPEGRDRVSERPQNRAAAALLERFSALDESGGARFLALGNLQILSRDDTCLINIIDRCITPFASSRLRFWLTHPRATGNIEQRLEAIDELINLARLRKPLFGQSVRDGRDADIVNQRETLLDKIEADRRSRSRSA
jgi:hypothetical protein